ncbi:ABC transporter ATP-binding protein [Polaromonas sp.]|uniref:ABC transporter ATP-binding protein n=1 Tax=Polaromonas sp. TaxID=1869339 RepID=UPI002FC69BDF
MRSFAAFFLTLLTLSISPMASAQEAAATPDASGNKIRFQFSPYSRHFTYNSEHAHVFMLGLERERPDRKLDGVAVFRNSFGQPSAFLYPWGERYPSIAGITGLDFKWTAGLLYGYRAPYENKVPLNYKGFSPGLILALSYQITPRLSTQINMLGTAGLMLQLNAELP